MLAYASWLVWIIPIIGAFLSPLVGAFRRKLSSYVAIVCIGLSAFFSFWMLLFVLTGQIAALRLPWVYPEITVLIDPLSALMASVITCIGLLVTLFSAAYMAEEPSLARFWFLIQIFIGGYLVIVLAGDLLFMFVGWEAVGICCTGLAAFWHKEPSNAQMGLKTFLVLRAADVLLLTSLLLIYTHSGTLNIVALTENSDWLGGLAKSGLLFITPMLFFGGAMGKSAQLPFQEWLPDALAASPSSFNALTECLAGPFIMARVLPIFHHAAGYGEVTNFLLVMAFVGALTAVMSSLLATVQVNIFKLLSYCISSAIGYMMAAYGLAGLMGDISWGYLAGTFLLTIDAFVSALLFLGAAHISYAVGSDRLPQMGGFKSRIAHLSMEVGAFALGGIPPLSGFWCTNWIQTVAWDFASEVGTKGQFMLMVSGHLIFVLLIVGAGITAFYSLRMIGFIMMKQGYVRRGRVVKEPPLLMRSSLVATLVITAGLDFFTVLLIWPFNLFLVPMPFLEHLTFNGLVDVLAYIVPSISTILTCVAIAAGGLLSLIYVTFKADAESLMKRHRVLGAAYRLLQNRFCINLLYYRVAQFAETLSKRIYNSLEYGFNAINGFIGSRFLSLARMTYKYVEMEGIEKPQISGLSDFFDVATRKTFSLSQWAYRRLELGGLEAVNRSVVQLVTYFSSKMRKTQTGVLSYNMLIVLVGIVLMVILILRLGGIL